MKGGWLAGVATTLMISLIAGCGGCGGPGVDMATAKGNVKVAGQPMADITVTFTPASGRPATGLTDAKGDFTLATFKEGDGAALGKHKVSFNHTPQKTSPTGPPTGAEYMPTPDMRGGPGGKGKAAPAAPFNAKYSNPGTSGIEVEVVAGKTNEFSWDLEK